jgi:Na+/H+ antiporter NhaC
MSSTVTTATVSAVTTATISDGLGHSLYLTALVVLAIGLFARELLLVSNSQHAKRWRRGLDVGNAPLLISFAVIAALTLWGS